MEGLHQLGDEEAVSLGRLLRLASAALVEVTGCERTYVLLLAEAAGFAHLHFHVVPRHRDLPADARGAAVFRYLGVPPAEQLPEADRETLAGQLRDVIIGRSAQP